MTDLSLSVLQGTQEDFSRVTNTEVDNDPFYMTLFFLRARGFPLPC